MTVAAGTDRLRFMPPRLATRGPPGRRPGSWARRSWRGDVEIRVEGVDDRGEGLEDGQVAFGLQRIFGDDVLGLGGLQQQGGQVSLGSGDRELDLVGVTAAGIENAVADPHRPLVAGVVEGDVEPDVDRGGLVAD